MNSIGNFVEEVLFLDKGVAAMCVAPENNEDSVKGCNLKQFYKQYALLPNQTHSLNVKVVEDYFENLDDTDAIITFKKDLPVGIITADCVPIIVYAPDVKGVGAIHAGWKGTLGGIVDNVLEVLQERGADLSQLIVVFGPSISKKRYEVDNELAGRFIEAGFKDYVAYPENESGAISKPHIDLQGVNMERFLRRGIKHENIHLHSGCSYDSKRNDGRYAYPSHRRSHGAPDRMLTYISLS